MTGWAPLITTVIQLAREHGTRIRRRTDVNGRLLFEVCRRHRRRAPTSASGASSPESTRSAARSAAPAEVQPTRSRSGADIPQLAATPAGNPATASHSCTAAPGGPRSSPAAAVPCGSAAAPETAGAPSRCRRPTPQGPTQPRHLRAAQVVTHRRRRRPQAAGDGSNAQRRGEVQPQYLSNPAHGQPPVRQRSPLLQRHGGSHVRRVVPRRSAPTEGDRFRPESVIDFSRNR